VKKIIIVLVVFGILFSCKERREHENIFDSNPDHTESMVIAIDVIGQTDDKDYREYIDNYDSNLVWLFEVEGNFTNSGNREIIGFYQWSRATDVNYDAINRAYCFVLDSENKKVQSVYEIAGYGTLSFSNINNIDKDPMEKLGRDVIWLGHRIGCIGDFNENGKEELYFFMISGWGIMTAFNEFNGNEFSVITKGYDECDNYYDSCRVVDVDKEHKLIKFKRIEFTKDLMFSIIWSEDIQRYIFFEGEYHIESDEVIKFGRASDYFEFISELYQKSTDDFTDFLQSVN